MPQAQELPNIFPRTKSAEHILLTVTDHDPELLAVALEQHAKAGLPPPSQVRIMTTDSGRGSLLDFITPSINDLSSFTKEQRPITPNDIVAYTDERGETIGRLATSEELRDAGDSLLTEVRNLTQSPKTALHIIIPADSPVASSATLAMTYFGRPQDRLSLLIAPPATNSSSRISDYFFDKASALRRSESCSLYKVATVSLRDKYEAMNRDLNTVPQRVRASDLARESTPELTFDFSKGEVIVRPGIHVALSPSLLAFYYWMALRAAKEMRPVVPATDADAVIEFLWVRDRVLNYAVKEQGPNSRLEQSAHQMLTSQAAFQKFFDEKKSNVNHALQEALASKRLFRRYGIHVVSEGLRPKHYAIPMQGGQLGLVDG